MTKEHKAVMKQEVADFLTETYFNMEQLKYPTISLILNVLLLK